MRLLHDGNGMLSRYTLQGWLSSCQILVSSQTQSKRSGKREGQTGRRVTRSDQTDISIVQIIPREKPYLHTSFSGSLGFGLELLLHPAIFGLAFQASNSGSSRSPIPRAKSF